MSDKTARDEIVKPDVLIPFNTGMAGMEDASISLIGVRPETNKVTYEAAIIKAASPVATVVYLANISGKLINSHAIVACHYSCQLQFTISGKEEIARYPEMIQAFEEKFKTPFSKAKILGAYESIVDFNIFNTADDLFNIMVPPEDFLELYGHTIKRIGEFFIINYDIPSVLSRHTSQSDMFVIAVRLKDNNHGFSDINHLIYEKMIQNAAICIMDIEKRKHLAWYDQVRRTYHISKSHIEAMFDLTDYIFNRDGTRIGYEDTPLGRRLLEKNILTHTELKKKMTELKDRPLVYINEEDGSSHLVNIIREGIVRDGNNFIEKSLDECCRIIQNIDWEKSMVTAR